MKPYIPPTYTYAPLPESPLQPKNDKHKSKTGLVLGIAGGVTLFVAIMVIAGLFIGSVIGDFISEDAEVADVADVIDVVEDVEVVEDIEEVEVVEDIVVFGEEEFDLLMDELFADWVSSDTLTMNYFLADPYRLDIERPEPTFGEVLSPEMILESKEETRELSEKLNDIEYELLRTDQQVIYDILMRNIRISKVTEQQENYSYYTGYIRPLNGTQVILPVLLAEFSFYTAEDIERYLDLLEDTHRYFNDIIEFERERSNRGFFLNEYNVDSVIEQIESYLENREDNLLIDIFDDRIDNYDGLSDQQRESYKQRNKELVLGNVLPAYDSLLDAMRELRGVGARAGGLVDLPGGMEYAHALLRLRTGTDRSVVELGDLLDKWIDKTLNETIYIIQSDPQLLEKLLNNDLGHFEEGTPESYISALQSHITEYFPPIDDTRLNVLEVHESLQEHTSPAFYLVPAVDRFDDNVVYVNPSSIIDDYLLLFTILAHESYPGHMYQTVYFLQQSPHPLRIALSNTGYSEGWATYSEMLSYFFALPDVAEATIMWNDRFLGMLIQSSVDLGVNVLGWSFDDVAKFLERFGITSIEAVESIYNTQVGVPLNSVNYALGYIELLQLIEHAESKLGEDFELIDFHSFYLDFGPAPYPIIRTYMDRQIEEHQSETLQPAA